MTTGAVMAAFAEALMHVTRMTRCRACGMAFATANPEPGSWVARAETCPAGHEGQYAGADYYYV
jgi:hypothetical protein